MKKRFPKKRRCECLQLLLAGNFPYHRVADLEAERLRIGVHADPTRLLLLLLSRGSFLGRNLSGMPDLCVVQSLNDECGAQ